MLSLFKIFHRFELVEAHFDAVMLAKVDHHDISVGNTIIVRKGDGASVGHLINWELAKLSEDRAARAHEKNSRYHLWTKCPSYLPSL